MDNRLFLIGSDQIANELSERYFPLESELQEIVENNPDILSRKWDEEGPRKLYLVQREQEVCAPEDEGNSFSLDHLLVDSEGIPVLVEVKRSTDTRIRREVVAQMIDYASRASSWDINKLRASFMDNNEGRERAEEIYNNDEFWNTVDANLGAGHLRLVFVADRIPDTLRILIEFLDNAMGKIEVYGVELKPYKNNDNADTTLLSSNIIGNSLEIRTKPTYQSRQGVAWTEETFLARVNEFMGEEGEKTAAALIDFSRKSNLEIIYGTGAKHASFIPKKDGTIVFSLVQRTNPARFVIEFYIDWLEKLGADFGSVLNSVEQLCDSYSSRGCWHTDYSIWIELELLKRSEVMNGFKEIIQKIIESC